MKVRAVDFVGIPVKDIAVAKEFYGSVLGLSAADSFGEAWAEYDAGGTTIALIQEDAEAIDKNHQGGPNGAVSVALAVADVGETLEELRAKGVTIVYERNEFPPCFMALIEDPSGNWLWLHQRRDGTAG